MKQCHSRRAICFLFTLSVFILAGLFTYVQVIPTINIQEHQEKNVVNEYTVSEMDPIMKAAEEKSKGGKAVLVTLVNNAYLPFTFSWLCNTQEMGVHKQVLFITGDKESALKITQRWPEVTAIHIKGLDMKGDQVYSHVGYVRLMVHRTLILLEMLQRNIKIFLFEVDCLWIKNPLHELQKYSGYDILVNAVSERPKVVAGGFLYMYPTETMKKTWKALTSRLMNLDEKLKKMPREKYISEGDNDQEYLSALVFSKFEGLKYKMLSLDNFADGKWYEFKKEKQEKLHPYIINNNWVLGNPNKIARAKKWGHWFIKEDFSCDTKQVKKIVEIDKH